MTESEWLSSSDPAAMLYVVSGPEPEWGGFPTRKATARQLRLFAAACCRCVWHLLTDASSRRAVEVAELYADGLATLGDMRQACDSALEVNHSLWPGGTNDAATAASWCASTDNYSSGGVLKFLSGHASAQTALLRSIIGNPFRPVTIDPAWLTWNNGAIPRLAQAIYDERVTRACERCGGSGLGDIISSEGHGLKGKSVHAGCKACHRHGIVETGELDAGRCAMLADALEEAGCIDLEAPQWVCNRCGQTDNVSVWTAQYGDYQQRMACGNCGIALPASGNVRQVFIHSPHPIIAHLRGPGPHVRGDWVLDLLLGKE